MYIFLSKDRDPKFRDQDAALCYFCRSLVYSDWYYAVTSMYDLTYGKICCEVCKEQIENEN